MSKKRRVDKWLRENFRKLAIVFVSQFGVLANWFKSDCGAACALMIIKFFRPNDTTTVNELYRMIKKKDEYLSIWEIQNLLRYGFGIETTKQAGKTIEEFIDKKKGVIALIEYKGIQVWEKNPHTWFKDMHFVVVLGYEKKNEEDEGVYLVHDPLYPEGDSYRVRRIPISVFNKAWSVRRSGRLAIVTVESISEVY